MLWLLFGSRAPDSDGSAEASQTRLLSFDVFDQRYAAACMKHVRSVRDWGERIEFVRGNSEDTVAAVSARRPGLLCDVVMIDGLHTGQTPLHDLQNSLSLVAEGALVVLDDAGCSSWWCEDVTAAVTWAHDNAMFRALKCPEFSDTRGATGMFPARSGSRGWCEAEVARLCEVCAPEGARDTLTCKCSSHASRHWSPSNVRWRQPTGRRRFAPPLPAAAARRPPSPH